jgi:hypothetical protein
MTILLPHVAARLFDTELAMVDAGKLRRSRSASAGASSTAALRSSGAARSIMSRFPTGAPSESMGRLGDPLGSEIERAGYGDRMLYKVGNVAVIPIEGTLVHKGKAPRPVVGANLL